MLINDFFEKDYISYGSYDLVRKIASYVDGQKNSSRKVIHTLIQQNINSFVKVSNLGPKVQEYTQYLHGSIEGIIVRLAQDYVGSNNIPLVQGDGSFGTTFIPTASATRYIFARKAKVLDTLFPKDDFPNLIHQTFEGDKIEPRFYVPTLPLIAINGAEGLAVGFSQKILPRSTKDVIKYIKNIADSKQNKDIPKPYWNNMLCNVSPGENDKQWVISGTFERINTSKIKITSLPIGYTLKDYQTVLDNLVDTKVIKDYDDNSDDDIFDFTIYAERTFVAQSDDVVLKKLKLQKTVTENYTCLDENNKIVVFSTFDEMLGAWYNIRYAYNLTRISSKLQALREQNKLNEIKRKFIELVLQEKVIINKRTDDQIKLDISNTGGSLAEDIILSYDVLMSIPLRQFTTEQLQKLDKQIQDNLQEIETVKKLTPEILIVQDAEMFIKNERSK